MSELEKKYHQEHETGFPIFKKLFELNKDDFLAVMKDIFQYNNLVLRLLKNEPRVVKTIVNDEPNTICIYFYDSIEVNAFGVRFKPEHGESTLILKFDKLFNVDIALEELSK